MKFAIGSLVENVFPTNGKRIVVRVIGIVSSAHTGCGDMYRVTDNLSEVSTAKIIAANESWAAPEENIVAHESDCAVCHRDGLVWIR